MSQLAQIRFLCRCLMPDYAPLPEEALRGADWPQIFQIAGEHLVTPPLAGALARSPHWASLPPEYRDYLSAVRELNQLRNATLRRELLTAIREINRLGVEPVLLKGAICLMSRPYEGSEDRVMGDLDLLVPVDAIEPVFGMLQQRGYGIEHGSDADVHGHAEPASLVFAHLPTPRPVGATPPTVAHSFLVLHESAGIAARRAFLRRDSIGRSRLHQHLRGVR